LKADALCCSENRLVEELMIFHGKGTCQVKTIRGRQRGDKRRALRRARVSGPVVRIGKPDASLTGLAGLVTVDELAVRLGIVAELDRAIGPVKDRDRGHTAGQLLVGMAAGLLAGQDCLAGLDRVRADAGSGLLAAAPVPAATTAAGLARRFHPQAHGPHRLAGIEAGLAKVYQRWLGLVPAMVRAPLVLRDPTIDCDATDIEVYGAKKDRVGWNYAGVKCGRVHLASWAQAELPLAMDLLAGNDDVRPDAPQLLARALAVLPPQVCGRPRVRADAGYFDQSLAHAAVERGCDYAIAAKRNPAVWRALAAIPEEAWSDARDMPGGQVAACDYTPAGWPEGSYSHRAPREGHRQQDQRGPQVPAPPDHPRRAARPRPGRSRRTRLGRQLHRHQHPRRRRSRHRRVGSLVPPAHQHRRPVPRGQARWRAEPPALR